MRSVVISGFPHVSLGSVLLLCQPGLTLKEIYPGVFSGLEIQLVNHGRALWPNPCQDIISFCRERGGEQFGLCKTHLTESSPFIAQSVRCGHWQGGMCMGSAGTCSSGWNLW